MGLGSVIALAAITLVSFLIGGGTNAAAMVAAVVFFPAALALYASPFLVAYTRRRRNLTAIAAVNLLLGWTFVGWVVALVWALSEGTAPSEPAEAPIGVASDQRACPFCAETIKAAAVVCRHCGRDVQPVAAEVTEATRHIPAAMALPTTAPKLQDEELMAAYGITLQQGKYCLGPYRYDKLSDAVAYAKRTITAEPGVRP